jgi:hypothetical protein
MAGLALLAGCAASAAVTPAPAASDATSQMPAVSPVPTKPAPATPKALTPPPPTPSPAPKVYGDSVFVEGWEVCMPPGFTVSSPDTTGTVKSRDGGITCTDEMNDPRVSGTASGPWQFNGWGDGLRGALVQWSPRMELKNEGGSWIGTYAGFYTPETGDDIVIWYTGTGAYEGLSYVQWIEAPPGHVTGGTTVIGLIFPGDLPPTVAEAAPAP